MGGGETRVLLVEDDVVDALSVKRALSEDAKDPFELIHVSRLDDALAELSSGEVGIVLLDLDLPDSERMETVGRILSSSPDKPVVVLSGHADEVAAVEAVQAGAQDYLFKEDIGAGILRRAIRHAISRKHQELALARQAYYDDLTGLPTRGLVLDRWNAALARAKRVGDWVGLIVIDLDGFKQINDTYGHVAGDQVLVEVSKRLGNSMRQSDTVARFGGDEFVVVLEGVRGLIDVQVLAQKLKREMEPAICLSNCAVTIGASFGETVSSPDQIETFESALARADRKMYGDKKQGFEGKRLPSSPGVRQRRSA